MGMFFVIVVDEELVVLKDVYFGQVYVFLLNFGVFEDEVVCGIVVFDLLMNVLWQFVEVELCWIVFVECLIELLMMNFWDIVVDNFDGEFVCEECVGIGEIYVLLVFDDMIEQVVDDIFDDREGLFLWVVRFDVNCVEICLQLGVVVVCYMF